MKVFSQTLLSSFECSAVFAEELCLSIPGKTFLAGEYLALSGGKTLVMATSPRFKMSLSLSSVESASPFHIESPAGKLWQIHQALLRKYNIQFQDPYLRGGFGASSAQFALLWSCLQILKFHNAESLMTDDSHDLAEVADNKLLDNKFSDANLNKQFDDKFSVGSWGSAVMAEPLLDDYRVLAQYQGKAPSGADIIGPFIGGLCRVQREPTLQVESSNWPFSDKGILLFHTQKKLPTHDHISQIQEIPDKLLSEQMEKILCGLQEKVWDHFVSGLSGYRQILQSKGWLAQHTAEILSFLDAHPKVLFAKGCGAMGADVVAVFCAKDAKAQLIAEIQEKGLILMASEENITNGIGICN